MRGWRSQVLGWAINLSKEVRTDPQRSIVILDQTIAKSIK